MSLPRAVSLSAIILSVVSVCRGGMWYFTRQTKYEAGWPRKPPPSSPGTLQSLLLGLHSSPSRCSTDPTKQALDENQLCPGAQRGPPYSAFQAAPIIYSKSCSARAKLLTASGLVTLQRWVCCFTHLAPSLIHCHSFNTPLLNVGAARWYQHDDTTVSLCVTISWAFFGTFASAPHLPAPPLLQDRVGMMTWLLQH